MAIDPNQQFVIQIRHPFHAIQSWHQFDLDEVRGHDYDAYFADKLKFWKSFAGKWCFLPGGPVVTYTSLDDILVIRWIARYMGLRETTPQLVWNLFTSRTITLRDSKIDYAAVQRSIEPILDRIGIPLIAC